MDKFIKEDFDKFCRYWKGETDSEVELSGFLSEAYVDVPETFKVMWTCYQRHGEGILNLSFPVRSAAREAAISVLELAQELESLLVSSLLNVHIIYDSCWLMAPENPLWHLNSEPRGIKRDSLSDSEELKVFHVLPLQVEAEIAKVHKNATNGTDETRVRDAARGRFIAADIKTEEGYRSVDLEPFEVPVMHEKHLVADSTVDKKIIALAKSIASETSMPRKLVFVNTRDGGILNELVSLNRKEQLSIFCRPTKDDFIETVKLWEEETLQRNRSIIVEKRKDLDFYLKEENLSL